ncbi:MAG: IS982 family transposase [Bacteroidetes bacterium]|nr:IS982 family transposase [Bacteroidota bacterium]
MILFHMGQFRNMKCFYQGYVVKHLSSYFPNTVSYNRFVELTKQVVLPMTILLKTYCLGNSTGIFFSDSTPIRVCKNKRIRRNNIFSTLATTGKSTMGWFYGFKLHLVVNDKREILNFAITQANVDDRDPLKNKRFILRIRS